MIKHYVNIAQGRVVNRAAFEGNMPEGWAPKGELWMPSDIAQIGWLYEGGQFSLPPSPQAHPVTATNVKSEAGRRIAEIMPDYKQRNVLAFGLETMMTYGTDPSQWPEPLQQVNADMQAKWEAIKAIRARSDEIEAMDPIPTDFQNDKHWPAA